MSNFTEEKEETFELSKFENFLVLLVTLFALVGVISAFYFCWRYFYPKTEYTTKVYVDVPIYVTPKQQRLCEKNKGNIDIASHPNVVHYRGEIVCFIKGEKWTWRENPEGFYTQKELKLE